MDTYQSIASEVHSIRYGKPGKLLFNFREKQIAIREPTDVLLVGSSPLAAVWIARRYAILLACITRPTTRLRE